MTTPDATDATATGSAEATRYQEGQPTQTGYYWVVRKVLFSDQAESFPEIAEVRDDWNVDGSLEFQLIGNKGIYPINRIVRFAGPIPEPPGVTAS